MEKVTIVLSLVILIDIAYDIYNRGIMDVYFYSIKDIHPKIIGPIFWFLVATLNFYEDNNQITLMMFFLGILYIINDTKRDIITNKGIYTKDGNFKWKDILGFEWEENLNIRKKENYYALYFKTQDDKFIFKVKEEDKNKVDELLKEKLGDRDEYKQK